MTDQSVEYLTFRSSLPRRVHDSIAAVLRHLSEDTSPWAVPDEPLYDPAVQRAVTAMLGPSAQPDECRHVHVNHGPTEAGPWHVDDYCGRPWPVGVRFAVLCYFPQDTPPELGPTQIRVGGREVLASGPAGSCLLMAHTVEHRATANVTGRERYMLKYLFRCA